MLKDANLLTMLLRDLGNLVPHAIPLPYSLRMFIDGDEEAWLRIHLAADLYNAITPSLFTSEFGSCKSPLERRQFYAVDERHEAVGTVTAWFPESQVDPACGRLHWLAVMPDHQRLGLGSALVSAVLIRMRELGYTRCYLITSAARHDAVRLYNRFGFRVVPRQELLVGR